MKKESKSVVIIAGRTASGKSTILDNMVENLNYEKLITTTTREPRDGEVNGVDYHFISKEDFKQKIKEGFFLENVSIKGNFYGVGLNAFDKDFGSKKPVLILDPIGVKNATERLKKENISVMSVFVNESIETCLERLTSRISSEEEKKNREYDLKNLEGDWDTYTKYSMKTTPLSTTVENAKNIDENFKKFKKEMKNKSKPKKNKI